MLSSSLATYEGLNVTTDDIYADHTDIARFANRQDPGYFQLVGHISKLSRRAKQEGKVGFTTGPHRVIIY